MEKLTRNTLKRIKVGNNQSHLPNDFKYNFEVFLAEECKRQKGPNRISSQRCFFELFDKNYAHFEAQKPPKNLQSIMLVAFCGSLEFMKPLFTSKVQTALVMDEGSPTTKASVEVDQVYPNVIMVHPRKEFGMYMSASFHPKMILVKFDDRLRVIIGSGNLAETDWAIWENIFWMKDFYPAKDKQSTRFGESLTHYIHFMLGQTNEFVSNFLGIDLSDYDFNETQICLVPSLPGRWKKRNAPQMSFHLIQTILDEFKPKVKFTMDNIRIRYVSSSVSMLTVKLLADFVQAFVQDPALNKTGNNPAKSKAAEKVSILYPSAKFIKRAKGGLRAGGCLFMDSTKYQSPKFQRGSLKQYDRVIEIHESPEKITELNSDLMSYNRPKVPHMKVSVITNSDEEVNDDTIIYFGSHNFTVAAWGQLELDGTQVSISNYELGIMLPPQSGSKDAKKQIIDLIGIPNNPASFGNDAPFFR